MKKQIISKSVQKECSEKMKQLVSHLLEGNTGTLGSLCKNLCTDSKPASKRTISKNLRVLVNKGVVNKTIYFEGQLKIYSISMGYKKSNLQEVCLTLDLKKPLN